MTTTYEIDIRGNIIRSDGAVVPNDALNLDYKSYLTWVSAGHTAQPRVLPLTATDVDTYRDRRLAAGFVDSVTGKTYQCDETSRGFLAGLGSAAGFTRTDAPSTTYPIITSDNSIVVLSAADAYSLISARILPWVSATIHYARSMKNNISAGSPPEDISTGWP